MINFYRKWGVQILALNETDYLEAVIRMFQPFVDKIVVSNGDKGWCGDVKNNGEVKKIVNKLSEQFNNVYLHEGHWDSETEQRNDCLSRMQECDYIFIVDADELWSSGDIHKMKDYILAYPGYSVFRANWNTRFKNIEWRVEPREPFKPVVAIKKGISFVNNREVEQSPYASVILVPERTVLIEHLSYVRKNDEDIKNKIMSFSHANEVIKNWYEYVYLKADLNMKNLHPTNSICYQGLIEDEIHPEIMKFLKEYSSLFT